MSKQRAREEEILGEFCARCLSELTGIDNESLIEFRDLALNYANRYAISEGVPPDPRDLVEYVAECHPQFLIYLKEPTFPRMTINKNYIDRTWLAESWKKKQN